VNVNGLPATECGPGCVISCVTTARMLVPEPGTPLSFMVSVSLAKCVRRRHARPQMEARRIGITA